MCTFFRAPVALALAASVFAGSSPARAAALERPLVVRYADALGSANARLAAPARLELAQRLLLISSYYRVDPRLLIALVTVESSWRARAVSPSGALGLGQLMPATAATLEVDALEPYENLDGTARYLRRLLNRYAARTPLTRMRLAVASYNAGPAAVERFNGIPPYPETQAYVEHVVTRWQHLAATLAIPATSDLGVLTAPAVRRTRIAQAAHASRAPTRPKRLAAVPHTPYHSPYLDAPDPNGVPLPTPSPVVWERSHSFFARLLGLRHRALPQR